VHNGQVSCLTSRFSRLQHFGLPVLFSVGLRMADKHAFWRFLRFQSAAVRGLHHHSSIILVFGEVRLEVRTESHSLAMVSDQGGIGRSASFWPLSRP